MKLEVINNTINGNINKKICVISDIHYYYDYKKELFKNIIDNIRLSKPDYICIPGDLIDNATVAKNVLIINFYNFIKDLGMICQVIISVGNHDINFNDKYTDNNEFWNKLNAIDNVYVLNNKIKEIGDIRFIGYTQNFSTVYDELKFDSVIIKDLGKLLKKIDNKKYNILLAHDPLYIGRLYDQINNYNLINLMVSGHTHGGMVPSRIKGNWALISPCKRFFVKDSRGYFKKGNTDIVISGGIIKLSYKSGIFHFFNFVYPSTINYIDVKE